MKKLYKFKNIYIAFSGLNLSITMQKILLKKAIELNNSYSSDSKSSGVSAGVNVGYGRKVLTDNASVSVSSSKSNMNSNETGLNEEQFVNEREIGERYERK